MNNQKNGHGSIFDKTIEEPKLFICFFCGLKVNEIPKQRKGECSANDHNHCFKKYDKM